MKQVWAGIVIIILMAGCSSTDLPETVSSTDPGEDVQAQEETPKPEIASGTPPPVSTDEVAPPETTTPPTTTQAPVASAKPWMDLELIDVETGESFTIGDYRGEKVVLQSFAVWCPYCLQQQKNVKALREGGDVSVHIAMEFDPNADPGRIQEHRERYGFDWTYTIGTQDMVQALLAEYGPVIVDSHSTSIILICEDQSTRLLRYGVKGSDELAAEIAKGC